jgi:RNA recognition motif-containing protein
MRNKLFVGNLAYTTTAEDLKVVFRACGTLNSLKVITSQDTGQSKGFAFVEYSNEEGAERALESFNGFELNGRSMRISYAEERAPRPPPSNTFSEAPPDYPHKGKGAGRSTTSRGYSDEDLPNRRPKTNDRRERGGGNRRRYQEGQDWD